MQKEANLFASLFQGLERAYMKVTLLNEYEERPSGKKRLSKNWWVEEPLTVEVFANHLVGKCGMGVGPVTDNNTSFFGVIDIDDYNWPDKRLLNLCHRIEQSAMPLVPARSKSGGVRLYLFCEESPAEKIKNYLKSCAAILGFKDAEVFPASFNLVKARGDKGNAVALPYFNAKKTECPGFWKEDIFDIQEFIKFALSRTIKTDALDSIPGIKIGNAEAFVDGPPCLQLLSVNGFPEGTRGQGLFNIGVYLRLRYGDDGPDRYLDEYNDRCMSPPLPSVEVVKILKSVTKKTYFYTCKKEPICNVCNKSLCLTRKLGIGSGSGEANITLGKMIKYDCEPPLWIVEVNNRRIEFETEEIFLDVRAFKRKCVEKLHLIPNITAAKLVPLLNKALESLETLEAPEDASSAGQCIALFHQYLHSKPPAKNKDEIAYKAPWYEEGYVYFRSQDFMDYLDMQKFRRLDSRKVAAILRDFNKMHGGELPDEKAIRVGKSIYKCRCVKYDKPEFQTDDVGSDF